MPAVPAETISHGIVVHLGVPTNPIMSTQKQRHRYDEAFKREAVRLWKSSKRGAEDIARELGISLATLYAWAKARERGQQGGAAAHGLRELKLENARLRTENERLRLEREVLKKTLAILSEPHKGGAGDGEKS